MISNELLNAALRWAQNAYKDNDAFQADYALLAKHSSDGENASSACMSVLRAKVIEQQTPVIRANVSAQPVRVRGLISVIADRPETQICRETYWADMEQRIAHLERVVDAVKP